MSGKRQATSDLNHDNWDREEEPEERGTFRTASENELKGRIIRKAKRKVATGSSDAADGGGATKSVFSGFAGFGKPAPAATTASSAFSFLAKIPSTTGAGGASLGGVGSSSNTTATTSAAAFSFGSSAATTTATSTGIPKTTMTFGSTGGGASAVSKTAGSSASTFSFGGTSTAKTNEETIAAKDKSVEYYAKLKGLNQAVSEWIKSHVDKNPLCILTPIFRDYEKYLQELEEEKSKAYVAVTTEKKTNTTTAATASSDTFKFSEANTSVTTTSTTAATFTLSSSAAFSAANSETPAKTNGISFGWKKPEEAKDSKPASATAGFSFGLKPTNAAATTSSPATTFSFGKPAAASEEGTAPKPFSFTPGGTPFSFGNIKPPEAPTTTENTNDDEDEEPPKNEFKQVVEDDAVYSKKCKVFVKKDGNFVEKGVGTLYLKPIESNGKTQLLVRADTNLGNILVNLILSSGLPSQRMGKNNVMLVCLPTPDVEKPTPMLLRVKTSEEADELLENIEKYKK